MQVIVTGARGQLGADVVRLLRTHGETVFAADVDEMDVTDENSVRDFFALHPSDAVVHCAAYTAVDNAESEPELCRMVNETGTLHVARCAEAQGAKLVYVSSDYIYPGTGDQPQTEDTPAAPLNVYGRTKYAGELAAAVCSRLFILRTSWVFGVHGENFPHKMLSLARTHDRLRVVDDQIGSPTFTEDLATLICQMLHTESYGTYNATNEGFCSWYDFAAEIFRKTNLRIQLDRVSTADFHAPADRPRNSRLSKAALMDAGFSPLPTWQDALDRFLAHTLTTTA